MILLIFGTRFPKNDIQSFFARSPVMTSCGARNFLLALAYKISTAATPYCSLPLPQAALANVPASICLRVKIFSCVWLRYASKKTEGLTRTSTIISHKSFVVNRKETKTFTCRQLPPSRQKSRRFAAKTTNNRLLRVGYLSSISVSGRIHYLSLFSS